MVFCIPTILTMTRSYTPLLSSEMSQVDCLLVILIIIGTVHLDIVEFEGVDSLAGGDDSKPISELVLLQELLGEVLEVSSRELSVGDDDNLSSSLAGDLDCLTKVAGSSVNLDSVVQEFLECST